MKTNLILSALFAMVMLYVQGCTTLVTPDQMEENRTSEYTVPLLNYGGIELFSEIRVPLQVAVTAAPTLEETSLVKTLQGALQKTDVNCTAPGKDCDIRIYVDSVYRELTREPQCRLYNITTVTVAASDGTKLLPDWKHRTENQQASERKAQAISKLLPYINRNAVSWAKKNFRREVSSHFGVSVLRFKMSRSRIELDRIHFERDMMKINKKLRSIDGVYDVRMIEVNKTKRIVSFRILHKRNTELVKEIKKQK